MSAQRASQLVEAGVWLQATGDQEGARRLFEQALKLDPDNPRARQFLGLQPGAAPAANVSGPYATPGPAERVGTGTLLYTPTEGEQVSTGTILFGPGHAQVPPRAEAKPPPPVPEDAPDAELDWQEAPPTEPPPFGERTPVEARPFGERTPVTPINSRRSLRPDATSGWDSTSDPGFFFVPPPVSPVGSPVAQSKWKDPLDIVTEGIHTPMPMRPPSASQAIRLEEELQTLLNGARDLQELDDHSGALEILRKALELDPLHAEASRLRDRSEQTLLAIYESKLGSMEATPKVLLKQDEIIWLNLDHRAGFVLAQIDGGVSYDDLFAICGMSRLDTARILAQLVEEGVIAS